MPQRICENCKEVISDNLHYCVYCGAEQPMSNILEVGMVLGDTRMTIHKLKGISLIRKLFIGACLVIILLGAVFSLVHLTKLNRLYIITKDLMNEGRYSEANLIVDSLGNYKDSKLLKYQIIYESLYYDCLNDLTTKLSTNDRYILLDVIFYSDSSIASYIPSCLISYEAIDSEGNSIPQYALFVYENTIHQYNCYGITDSLEADFAVISEADIYRSLITTAIRYIKLTGKKIGNVNMDRVSILFDKATP